MHNFRKFRGRLETPHIVEYDFWSRIFGLFESNGRVQDKVNNVFSSILIILLPVVFNVYK